MEHHPRQALVAYLAEKCGPSGNLGKKAAQKYVHILTSLSRRSFGYDFSFYTYGPFSRELASDLDLLAAGGVISVTYDSSDNAYSITATQKTTNLVRELPSSARDIADQVWMRFSGRTAKQLELISTILFVHDEEGLKINSDAMTDRVKALKPKYTTEEVKKSQDELSSI